MAGVKRDDEEGVEDYKDKFSSTGQRHDLNQQSKMIRLKDSRTEEWKTDRDIFDDLVVSGRGLITVAPLKGTAKERTVKNICVIEYFLY